MQYGDLFRVLMNGLSKHTVAENIRKGEIGSEARPFVNGEIVEEHSCGIYRIERDRKKTTVATVRRTGCFIVRPRRVDLWIIYLLDWRIVSAPSFFFLVSPVTLLFGWLLRRSHTASEFVFTLALRATKSRLFRSMKMASSGQYMSSYSTAHVFLNNS